MTITAKSHHLVHRRFAASVIASVVVLVVSAFAVASAPADLSFCPPGEGAGQCAGPGGVAVDASTGRVYVADNENRRIDVFEATTGTFLEAWGWGVATGAAESQTCMIFCESGIRSSPDSDYEDPFLGGGAGELGKATSVAVDNDPASPSYHDVYVVDGTRIQKFTPTGHFLLMWGAGVITAGAAGSGNLTSGSTEVTGVITTEKAFLPGQTVTGTGIPAETRIQSVGPGIITLSKPATSSAANASLTVAEGPGNVPVNEQQLLSPLREYHLIFNTRWPSPTTASTGTFTESASAASIQQALEDLPNIGHGNIAVTGSVGGPYTIEFKGSRFADTDVQRLIATGLGSGNLKIIRNGHSSPEICTEAEETSCSAGVEGIGEPGALSTESESIAVGPEGVIYVNDRDREGEEGEEKVRSRVEKFSQAGAYVGSVSLEGLSGQWGGSIAVDSEGNIYTVSNGGHVLKFHPTGEQNTEGPFGSGLGTNAGSVAIDSSGDLFVTEGEDEIATITKYTPAGGIVSRFGYGKIRRGLQNIAAYHSAEGDVLGAEGDASQQTQGEGQVHYLALPAAGPVLVEGSVSAEPIGNAKATLLAKVNPEDAATSYRFEYVDNATYQADIQAHGAGHGFDHAKVVPQPEGVTGSDFLLHTVTAEAGCKHPVVEAAEGKCLTPETVYHVRFVAKNGSGETSGESEFTTEPPLQIDGTWSAEVGPDGATLASAINPLGLPTTAYFQYVEDARYRESGFADAISVPEVDHGGQPLSAGEGEADIRVSAPLYPLTPATTYHYRAVVTDFSTTVTGPEHTFTTFAPSSSAPHCANEQMRIGVGAYLPDCRAYEMVSPVDKNNGDIVGLCNINCNRTELNQAALSGEKLTYSSATAFGDAPGGVYSNQYLATRGPAGWESHGISPPHRSGLFTVANTDYDLDGQFKALTPELSSAWLTDDSATPLTENAVPEEVNVYKRDNVTGDYEALTDQTPKVIYEADGEGQHELGKPEFQGYSANGQAAIFTARAALTSNAAGGSRESINNQLYEYAGGELHLVSVLPSGKADLEPSWAGTYADTAYPNTHGRVSVKGAISENGSRVFWSSEEGGSFSHQQMFVRENATMPQSKIKAGRCAEPELACTVTIGGTFWAATPDGSEALTTSGQELKVFDVASETGRRIAGEVKGVVGASEDLAYIYFVSAESLASGASAGAPNLYLDHEGTMSLVARLARTDIGEGTSENTVSGYDVASLSPEQHAARVTSDGHNLAFESIRSLTGYDNLDASNGEPDLEVYVYDANTNGLSCVSCNPSGSRPVGQPLQRAYTVGENPVTNNGGPERRWTAAWLPTWENSLYAPRALSSDGQRVFFNSFDALASQDTNGRQDVYEWEAPGNGDCEESSPTYSSVNGGCVGLISSGESAENSEFIDASASGKDVFFRTAASLDPRDTGLLDIYDAREDGGFAPPPPSPTACEGEACQNSPAPPIDTTPGSLTFSGQGNLVAAPAPLVANKHKAKPLTRAQKLKKALATCSRKAKRKRVSCQVVARKRYGSKSKSHASSGRRVK